MLAARHRPRHRPHLADGVEDVKARLVRIAGAVLAVALGAAAFIAWQATGGIPALRRLIAVSAPATQATPARQPSPAAPPSPPMPPALAQLQGALRERENGNYEAASAACSSILESDAEADIQRQALLLLGRSELQAGSYGAAAASLQRFVAAYPEDPDAATAYFWLGEALRHAGDGAGAGDAYRKYLELRPLLASYVQKKAAGGADRGNPAEAPSPDAAAPVTNPTDTPPPDAAVAATNPTAIPSSGAAAAVTNRRASLTADPRFRAGLALYQAGDVKRAARAWAEMLPQEVDPSTRAGLLAWLGKAAWRLNDPKGARARWAQAAAADPEGFWGLRARALLAGRRSSGGAPATAFDPARYAPRGQQAEAEAWLVSWAGRPAGGRPVSELPGEVTALDAFQRGAELWKLGEAKAATAEFREVQAACSGNPQALYALALYGRDQGFYRLSMESASRLLALVREARRNPPRFIEELAYPAAYADLVLKEAQQRNVDPSLFFALLRQESHFDPDAASAAGASGLAQLMPATAEAIAQELDDSSYSPERLWRPAVSVRYGLWYLSQALGRLGDDALAALAAYNAGPGNAARWRQAAGDDDDVFFVQIKTSETQEYIMSVYEMRAHYDQLYR